MDPELQKHYEDVTALMGKVHPLFQGVNSFVMMMTLADLIAQWLLSHPSNEQPRIASALVGAVQDRAMQLVSDRAEETRH